MGSKYDLYRNKCPIHNLIFTLYCPLCHKPKCYLCYDIHYNLLWTSLHRQRIQNSVHIDSKISKAILLFYKVAIRYNIRATFRWYINNINNKQINVYYFASPFIVVYNPVDHQKATIKLPHKINKYSNTICHSGKVYIIGGILINSVYQLNISTGVFESKEPMLIKKYWHSLCSNEKYIYTIGGAIDAKIVTDDCEKYNVLTDHWRELPHLNTPRSANPSFVFNNCYIYTFSGYNSTSIEPPMERLHIKKCRHWEEVHISGSLAGRFGMCSIQISGTQVLVFGGCTTYQWLSDCYILNFNKDTIAVKPSASLMTTCSFYNYRTPTLINGCLYAIDCESRMFSFSGSKWALVE